MPPSLARLRSSVRSRPTASNSGQATAIFWLTSAPQRLEMTREDASEASSMTYDPNNVFAKVLRGEFPCHKIYEDEDTLAFLDIMPRAEGHALVITKETASDLFDVSPRGLAKLMAVVKKLSPPIKEAVGADGVL